MDSRQIVEEAKIGALFLWTFYGHTALYLVLSLCRFCNYFYLYKWEMAELVDLFFPLCLNCDTVSLACIICLFPLVGSYSVELIYVLLGKGLLHHVFV